MSVRKRLILAIVRVNLVVFWNDFYHIVSGFSGTEALENLCTEFHQISENPQICRQSEFDGKGCGGGQITSKIRFSRSQAYPAQNSHARGHHTRKLDSRGNDPSSAFSKPRAFGKNVSIALGTSPRLKRLALESQTSHERIELQGYPTSNVTPVVMLHDAADEPTYLVRAPSGQKKQKRTSYVLPVFLFL